MERQRKRAVLRWWQAEKGASEAAAFIILFPFLAFLIFALIETGVNFAFRGQVDNVVQNVTRGVTQDGGVYWERTTSSGSAGRYLGAPGWGWEGWGLDQLNELCSSTGRCASPPTLSCTVAGGVTGGGYYKLATAAASNVTCTATVNYRTVTSLGSNPATSLGFSTALTRPITVTVRGVTTVGRDY